MLVDLPKLVIHQQSRIPILFIPRNAKLFKYFTTSRCPFNTAITISSSFNIEFSFYVFIQFMPNFRTSTFPSLRLFRIVYTHDSCYLTFPYQGKCLHRSLKPQRFLLCWLMSHFQMFQDWLYVVHSIIGVVDNPSGPASSLRNNTGRRKAQSRKILYIFVGQDDPLALKPHVDKFLFEKIRVFKTGAMRASG